MAVELVARVADVATCPILKEHADFLVVVVVGVVLQHACIDKVFALVRRYAVK